LWRKPQQVDSRAEEALSTPDSMDVTNMAPLANSIH
jgi:hypothetical protein